MAKKPFNITMEEELTRRLKIQALNEDTSASKIIEKLVLDYLAKEEQ